MTTSALVQALALIVLLFPVLSANPAAIAEDDIKQTLESYRQAWLRNDKAGVLDAFTDDAVILPHHGVEPRVGKKAIEEFWFPAASPPTPIHEFSQDILAIRVEGHVAVVYGKTKLLWSMLREGREEKWRNQGTFIAVLVKKNGRWRITYRMWDEPPNERIP
jgi:uncharacterized protein (TIGR02246 family)